MFVLVVNYLIGVDISRNHLGSLVRRGDRGNPSSYPIVYQFVTILFSYAVIMIPTSYHLTVMCFR